MVYDTDDQDRPKKRRSWELQIPLLEVAGRDDSVYYLVPELPIDLHLNLKDWVFIVIPMFVYFNI